MFIHSFIIFFLFFSRANYCGSIALNTFNMIKMFNTINRTSRFPTEYYYDTVGIYLRKFTHIIQNIINFFIIILNILLYVFLR